METMFFWDKEELFDHFVINHPSGDVLQTTKWGKLKACSGWTYYPLGVIANGKLQGSALILLKPLPLGFNFAYSPRGPIFSSKDALDALFMAGFKLLKDKKALVWKMDPLLGAEDPIWHNFVQERKLRFIDRGLDFAGVQPRYVMTLDLNHSLDRLLKDMKSKTRYNIRYSERKGVEIIHAKTREQLTAFYDLLHETAIRDGFTIRAFTYYEDMWEHLIQNNLAKLFLAYHGDQSLAAAICFRTPKRVWYVYGASSNYKRNLQASHLIQWEMIKWAKSGGAKVYDFRGVSGDLSEDNPLYGLYRFKEGFGAHLESYVGEFDLPICQGGYRLWQGGLYLHNWLRKHARPGSK